MPDVLHRNLQEVFEKGGAARRRAAIDELSPRRAGRNPKSDDRHCYAENCVLDVPPCTFVGR